MRQRFRMFRRHTGIFFIEDTATGRQHSLRTRDKHHALRLVVARNEAVRQPALNLEIARAYLMGSDPEMMQRTWSTVISEILKVKHGETLARWTMAAKDRALDGLLDHPVLTTTAEHLLHALARGTVSTNVYLRRIHNFAVDMGWIPKPILPRRQWPQVRHKEKRAITAEEHERILAREGNPELRAFYALMWHLGGSQSDVASLRAEDIDWEFRTVAYARRKTGSQSTLHFGEAVATILKSLPTTGALFPRQGEIHEKHRAKLFNRRCKMLGIHGVTLHSYRYAWAERARVAGMPERFAQEALGHGSKAVHRAYARKALVKVPSLEDYEIAMAQKRLVRLPVESGDQPETACR